MSDNKTIDQQFIEYVVKSLVSKPDAVIVDRVIDEKGVLLTLTVDPEDLGRVIGKRGATAQSLRTLLRALGTKQEARFNLKIFDNGTPKPERQEKAEPEATEVADEAPAVEEASPETEEKSEESAPAEDAWASSDESSASEEATTDGDDEEMSAVERTRRELEDLDDLDV